MEQSSQHGAEVRPGEVRSGVVLLSRLMWMFFGPMLLCLTTYGIVASGSGWVTMRDAAFVIVAALMVGGRWWEHRSGAAMTATGEPATVEHFRRYVRVLLPLAAGIWAVANVLGNHVLA